MPPDAELGPWPIDGLQPVSQCPLCGSSERELVHKDMTDLVFFCAPGQWTLFRCAQCRSGYLDPMPTPETLGLAYRTYYTHSASAPGAVGLMATLRLSATNGYRNLRFGSKDRPGPRVLGALVPRLMPAWAATNDWECRHLPRPQPGMRLLDVGSGNGHFLDFARKCGWNVTGVDLDEKAVAAGRSRGLDVRSGTIEAIGADEQFDGITMGHVIEHVFDPLALLGACYQRLRPGGWIWVDTPNIDSLGHAEYGPHWVGVDAPRHLILFTPASLTEALARAGFVNTEPLHAKLAATFNWAASEAIAAGTGLTGADEFRAAVKERAMDAVHRETGNPAVREWLTVRAHKPT
jgi:2-polyprenyl-3-methyl-5-hydroxy-6-metoxy-1,4-benzoquinol methylase